MHTTSGFRSVLRVKVNRGTKNKCMKINKPPSYVRMCFTAISMTDISEEADDDCRPKRTFCCLRTCDGGGNLYRPRPDVQSQSKIYVQASNHLTQYYKSFNHYGRNWLTNRRCSVMCQTTWNFNRLDKKVLIASVPTSS